MWQQCSYSWYRRAYHCKIQFNPGNFAMSAYTLSQHWYFSVNITTYMVQYPVRASLYVGSILWPKSLRVVIRYIDATHTILLRAKKLDNINFSLNFMWRFRMIGIGNILYEKNERLISTQTFQNNSIEDSSSLRTYRNTRKSVVTFKTLWAQYNDVLLTHFAVITWCQKSIGLHRKINTRSQAMVYVRIPIAVNTIMILYSLEGAMS